MEVKKMNEKDRIMMLVQEGIITAEEATVLLEKLAKTEVKKETEKIVDGEYEEEVAEEAEGSHDSSETKDTSDDVYDRLVDMQETLKEMDREISVKKERIEALEWFEQLTAIQKPYTIDTLLPTIEKEIKEAQEALQKKQDLVAHIETLMSNIEHDDELSQSYEELEDKKDLLEDELEELQDAIDDLEDVRDEFEEYHVVLSSIGADVTSTTASVLKQHAQGELEHLYERRRPLVEERDELKKQWRQIRSKRLSDTVDKAVGTAKKAIQDIDWDTVAKETGTFVGKMGKGFARLLSKNTKGIVEIVSNREVVTNGSQSFSKTYVSPTNTITIIDVKISNGDIIVKEWDQEYIQVEGKFKVFGSIGEESVEEAFDNRSNIEFTDEKMKFHVSNTRVSSDLVIFLPKREYDYVSMQSLNANIRMKNIKGKDYYVKLTNGDCLLKSLEGSMLELSSTNGDVTIQDGFYRDVLIRAVNGDVNIQTEALSVKAETTNGDVDILPTASVQRIEAKSTTGDVACTLPPALNVEATLHSTMGSITAKEFEVVSSGKKTKVVVHIQDPEKENMTAVQLTSSLGDVTMKKA